MAPVPQATPVERLALIPKLAISLAAALKHFLIYPVAGDSDTGLFRFVVYAALRRLLGTISVAQEQSTIKPTTVVFKTVAKELQFTPVIERTAKGLEVCVFGSKSASKTVLFFHGGGYVLGASPGHIKWAHGLQQLLGNDVNVLLPAYTTAPRGQYPQQLTEAAETLSWLLNDLGRSPGDVSTRYELWLEFG
jgi:acetyl esterase/lipase